MITMFASTKLQFTVLVFLVGSLLSTTIEAELAGYPPGAPLDGSPGKSPPFKPEWATLINMKKIPKVAVIPALGVCNTSTPNSCNWSCEHCNRPSDVVYCPAQKDWGLTYDDGPSEFTPALVDYLNSKGLKATFFVIGSRVVQNPEILKKIVLSGHQVGIHTYSHSALTTLTNKQIVAEIKWTEQAIKEAGGVTPKYVRPPFGDMDDRVRNIFDQLGYTPVIWDKDSSDWKSNTDSTFDLTWVPGNFSQWVLENDPTGHITLEHDFWPQTAAQGPPVIDIVSGAGYNVKTVAECQGERPYLEETPTSTPILPYYGSNSTQGLNSTNSTSSSSNTTGSSSNTTDSGTESVSIQNVESPTPTPQSSSAPSKHPIKISLIIGFMIGAVVGLVF